MCSLLSSSLRDHSCVLSIVQCLTTVEVSPSLLLILLFKLSQILSVGTPSRWLFFLYVLLICPPNFLSILSDIIGYSKLTLYFPCPRWGIRIFSRKIWYLFFLISFFIINLFLLFIYLFLAALGLCCCAWVFSSCGEWGLLLVVLCRLLIVVACLVAEHGLYAHGLR